ncbi:bifunctional protein FolD-like [Clytia hemisphaerica]
MCGVKDKEVTEAKVLSGKEISKKIKEGMKEEVQQIKEKNSEFTPGLTIVQVGDREDSNVYVRMKMKTATELGFKPEHVKVSKNASESELINLINSLNADKKQSMESSFNYLLILTKK